jgi:hypothetical protein
MNIRLSAKLGQKIHLSPTETLPADENPFTDWSAHLFRADRAQYILLTNTASLYSMVMFGKGITNDCLFLDRAISYMSEFIRDDGHVFLYKRLIMPSIGLVRFSKALNKSVIGSMNDLVYQAKMYLSDPTISPYEVSFKLNQTPLSILEFANPKEAFRNMNLPDRVSNDTLDCPTPSPIGGTAPTCLNSDQSDTMRY